jgi:hypothetical protein
MKIRSQMPVVVACLLALACVLGPAAPASAQPGTAFLQGRAGGMIPIGTFHKRQNPGVAYSVAAGYEFTDFLDGLLEFTHSFNDNDNFRTTFRGIDFVSNEVNQTFIVSAGPRINFMPSGSAVRPFMLVQVGWYHFANYNSIEVDGVSLLGDEDDDAFGFQAGLGIEGTIFKIYQQRGDELPLLEVTLGAHGSYHQAVLPNRPDRQFVTTMGSVGLRF